MRGQRWARILFLFSLLFMFSTGGCEFSCRTETDDSVDQAVDDVGDAVKDTIHDVKKGVKDVSRDLQD